MLVSAPVRKKVSDTVILLRYEPEVLGELLEIVSDPETGKSRLSQTRFAELCKKTSLTMGLKPKFSQKSISNYTSGIYMPDNDVMMVMGRVLGVTFVSDWGKTIDNKATLKQLRAMYGS